jgi:amidohydrolase
MEISELKKELFAAEDAFAPEAERVSAYIFNHPEIGGKEYRSAEFLTARAEELGFTVTRPYCGMGTAFRCEYGDGDGPKVAFLAEYDALPGYNNSPDGSGLAHACGHNWIAASTLAACAALKAVKPSFHGKIVWLGTPAEENLGAKVDMAKAGAFDDIDAAFQFHLGKHNCVEPAELAMCDFYYTFTGRASHAASSPQDGINALDACNLTFAGINALRQHVTPDVKLHGIITEGGAACNIVPDHCVMQYYVRAGQKDYLEQVIERVNNCARGAALMTGCTLDIKRAKNTYYDVKQDPLLREKMRENLAALGVRDFEKGSVFKAGSTDMGNVSYACPTCYCYMGVGEYSDADTHDRRFVDVADSELAHGLLHTAAKAMAATALDVLLG